MNESVCGVITRFAFILLSCSQDLHFSITLLRYRFGYTVRIKSYSDVMLTLAITELLSRQPPERNWEPDADQCSYLYD